MRIGIDVRYLSHGLVGGVHTYVAHFVPALIELAASHHVFLYADTKRPFELTGLPGHVAVRRLPYRNALSSVQHDLFMRRVMHQDQLDVVHFPTNYGFGPAGVPAVVTLHDAINILPLREIIRGHQKNARTVAMMTYLHALTTSAVRRASMLLTVSTHAAREIVRYSGFDPARVVAVPHAPTPDLRRVEDQVQIEAVRQRYAIRRQFVLADALKNPATLVRAWQRLPAELRERFQIVFFARHADLLPIVHAAVTEGMAQLFLRPSRADLIALYSMAEAFVFPSWIEGFGIPVLEAMTCGAPVIASDRGSIPEVAGDAALLADAEDDTMFAQHLEHVLCDPSVAAGLRERGYARASQFTWRGTAQQILASYVRAVG